MLTKLIVTSRKVPGQCQGRAPSVGGCGRAGCPDHLQPELVDVEVEARPRKRDIGGIRVVVQRI